MNTRQLIMLMVGVLVITPLALMVLAHFVAVEAWAGFLFPLIVISQIGFLVWYARRSR